MSGHHITEFCPYQLIRYSLVGSSMDSMKGTGVNRALGASEKKRSSTWNSLGAWSGVWLQSRHDRHRPQYQVECASGVVAPLDKQREKNINHLQASILNEASKRVNTRTNKRMLIGTGFKRPYSVQVLQINNQLLFGCLVGRFQNVSNETSNFMERFKKTEYMLTSEIPLNISGASYWSNVT